MEFREVCKTYGAGEGKITALKNVSFGIGQGEICVIVGASGAGKTTLLNILGGMTTDTFNSAFGGGQVKLALVCAKQGADLHGVSAALAADADVSNVQVNVDLRSRIGNMDCNFFIYRRIYG